MNINIDQLDSSININQLNSSINTREKSRIFALFVIWIVCEISRVCTGLQENSQ